MIKFTRLCDSGKIKGENNEIVALKVQTYGTINTSGIELQPQNKLGEIETEPFYVLNMKGNKKAVQPFEIVNTTNPLLKDLASGKIESATQNAKGAILKYNDMPCVLTYENGVFYASVDVTLIIYNI